MISFGGGEIVSDLVGVVAASRGFGQGPRGAVRWGQNRPQAQEVEVLQKPALLNHSATVAEWVAECPPADATLPQTGHDSPPRRSAHLTQCGEGIRRDGPVPHPIPADSSG